MKKHYEGTVEEDNIEELPDDFFTLAESGSKALPEIFGQEVADKLIKKSRRPRQKAAQVLTQIHLDAEVLAVFQSTGEGWETRVNEALKAWIAEHPIQ